VLLLALRTGWEVERVLKLTLPRFLAIVEVLSEPEKKEVTLEDLMPFLSHG